MHMGGPDNHKRNLQILCQLAFFCDLSRVIFVLQHSCAFNVRSIRQQPVRSFRLERLGVGWRGHLGSHS